MTNQKKMKTIAINSKPQLDALFGSITIKFLGSGSSGCVAKGKYNGKERVFKILALDRTEPSIREAFLGYALTTRLPEHIRDFFVGTSELYVSSVGIPDSWRSVLVTGDAECEDRIDNADALEIIIQDVAESNGVIARKAHTWLSEQPKALSFETVRSIIFQLTLALAYAQSELGFQHDDLKLENLMFVPVAQSESRTYKFLDGDIFVLPLGGIVVRLIDFGRSSIRLKQRSPGIIATTNAYSPFNIPFEYMLVYDFSAADKSLIRRNNDADTSALFKIMLNLIAHGRTFGSPAKEWRYQLEKDDKGKSIDSGADLVGIDPATVDLEALYKQFPSLRIEKPKGKLSAAKQKKYDNAVASADAQIASVALHVALYRELEPKWLVYKPSYKTAGATSLNATDQDFITGNFAKLAGLQIPSLMTNMFVGLSDAIQKAFPHGDVALHFIKMSGSPKHQIRNSFGVPAPFSLFGLANALYHPFLSYNTWRLDNTAFVGSALDINKPLAEQLVYRDDGDIIENGIIRDAELASTTYEATIQQLSTTPAVVVVTGGGGSGLQFFSTADDDGNPIPAPQSYQPWTDDQLLVVDPTDVPNMEPAQFAGLTDEQLTKKAVPSSEPLFLAMLTLFKSAKKSTAKDLKARIKTNLGYLKTAIESWRNNNPNPNATLKTKVNKAPVVITPDGGLETFANPHEVDQKFVAVPKPYVKWTTRQIEAFAAEDVPHMLPSQLAGLTDANLISLKDDGENLDVVNAILDKFGWSNRQTTGTRVDIVNVHVDYAREAIAAWLKDNPDPNAAPAPVVVVKKKNAAPAAKSGPLAVLTNGQKAPKEGGKWTAADRNNVDSVDIPKMTKEQFAGLASKSGLLDIVLDKAFLKAILRKFEVLPQLAAGEKEIDDEDDPKEAQEYIDAVKIALKKWMGTRKKVKGEIPISGILEEIEHRDEYVSADGSYDERTISTELYEPLQAAALESSLLIPIVAHLKLDKPLFDPNAHDVDMTNHANRTRYLHTLSVVAEMISDGVTQENVDRCFAEWPPVVPYKKGEVNEV